jgi:hypothetical protein
VITIAVTEFWPLLSSQLKKTECSLCFIVINSLWLTFGIDIQNFVIVTNTQFLLSASNIPVFMQVSQRQNDKSCNSRKWGYEYVRAALHLMSKQWHVPNSVPASVHSVSSAVVRNLLILLINCAQLREFSIYNGFRDINGGK